MADNNLRWLASLAETTGNRLIRWAVDEITRLREERRVWMTAEERALIESLRPRVRRPQRSVDYPHQRDAEWIAAIREAGVEVEW